MEEHRYENNYKNCLRRPLTNKVSGIYMDHASTTKILPEIITQIKIDLEEFWANPSNMYAFSDDVKDIVKEARISIAEAIGAKPSEIFFTSGASEGNAWIMAQKSVTLVSPYEHHNLLNHYNATIVDQTYLENLSTHIMERFSNGESKEAVLDPYKNFLLSWMMVNNETGEIFPIKDICTLAHKCGMKFHSDMTQAIGNVPINVKELGVDYATFTGHKIHAPKGVGFVYINSDTVDTIRPLLYGGGQEFHVRAGTENVPYIHALRMAVHSAIISRIAKQTHCFDLKKLLVEELNKYGIPFIINAGRQNVNNILNISIKDISGEYMMMELSDRNIFISTGSACNSGSMEPSHVLTEMGVSEDYIEGALRFSFDLSNTTDEIKCVAWHVNDIYRRAGH